MLDGERRLLIEADLVPKQGDRFQATGFPDLGAAEYEGSDGTELLLVESSQSMANRLEDVCLDDSKGDFVKELYGLPMIKVTDKDGAPLTNTVREAHRINSYYIFESDSKGKEVKDAFDKLRTQTGWDVGPATIAQILFGIDPNSLLHGMWIARKDVAGGRVRLPRVISAFIEARKIKRAISGGVKLDHINPGKEEGGGGAKEGQGNIPYPTVEHTAETITAYFSIDLEQIRGYHLSSEKSDLLYALALWKIRRFLDTGLRLRTACDLKISGDLRCTPDSFVLPDSERLDKMVKDAMSKCADSFAAPITVKYTKST